MVIPITTFCFLLGVGLHGIAARTRPTGNRVQQFLLSGMGAGAALIGYIALSPGISWPERLASVAAYAFACELYIFMFTFVTSSVSVSLLFGKQDTSATPPATMVAERLNTMVASGLLDRQADSFRLNPRSRRIVALYRSLRRFFNHSTAQD